MVIVEIMCSCQWLTVHATFIGWTQSGEPNYMRKPPIFIEWSHPLHDLSELKIDGIKMEAVNRLPPTNTKIKLDLTKTINDFHKPSIAIQRYAFKIKAAKIFAAFLCLNAFL